MTIVSETDTRRNTCLKYSGDTQYITDITPLMMIIKVHLRLGLLGLEVSSPACRENIYNLCRDGLSMILAARPANTGSDSLSDSDI